MPRQARKKSSTGIYHVMTRGIDRMTLFFDDEDRNKYLDILAKCLPGDDELGDGSSVTPEAGGKNCPRSGLDPTAGDGSLVPTSCDKGTVPYHESCDKRTVPGHDSQDPALLYNYCLMENHVHLLLKEGSEPLSRLMKRIGVRYAAFFKWKYHRTGHLFQDRFRSEAVENDSYFLAVYRYITLNPVKAGLCEKPGDYPWCGVRAGGPPVEAGSFVPTSCDKRTAPNHLTISALPVDVPKTQIWEYICADAPEIHPFPERILDGEARMLLLAFSGLQNPLDAIRLPKDQMLTLFYRLQEEGVSIQQLSRLTGIPKSNIARWMA